MFSGDRDHRYDPHEEERYKRPIRPKPIMIPVDAQAPPPRERKEPRMHSLISFLFFSA